MAGDQLYKGEKMKTEIEARFLECDTESILKKLKEYGATFVGDWLQIRNCYDFSPVRENSWIRLRTNGEETTLTIKEIHDKTISGTKESEIIVSNFEIADEILNKLGYHARSVQENRRLRYILDGVEIDIDFWPHIPTYIEFEGESEKAIFDVCKKLGLDCQKLVTLDVSSIYNYYGLEINNIKILSLEDERKNIFK